MYNHTGSKKGHLAFLSFTTAYTVEPHNKDWAFLRLLVNN